MSDIVQRLRAVARGESAAPMAPLCDAAADEIERVRVQLRQIDYKLDEIIERIKKLGI